MKSTLKITAKGQITLRKPILKELGVGPGDRVTLEISEPGRAELSAAKPQSGTLADFVGCLSDPAGPSLTIAQINAIIAQGWAGELTKADEA
jgi:antitoxin PrlF